MEAVAQFQGSLDATIEWSTNNCDWWEPLLQRTGRIRSTRTQTMESSIAVHADGKIPVGGFFTSIGGQTRNRIARLETSGSPTPTSVPAPTRVTRFSEPQRAGSWNISLKNNIGVATMAAGETERRYRRSKQSGRVRDDALECYSLVRELAKQRSESTGSADGTLPDLLATDFRVCLPPRFFR